MARKIRRPPVRKWSVDVVIQLGDQIDRFYDGVIVKASGPARATNRAIVAVLRALRRDKVRGRGVVRRVRTNARPAFD